MAKRMNFRDALDLVPDDLPDGAYWALAHEMAGIDYGDGFAELAEEDLGVVPSRKQRAERAKPPADNGEQVSYSPTAIKAQAHKPWLCEGCGQRFRLEIGARDHWRAVHSPQSPALEAGSGDVS